MLVAFGGAVRQPEISILAVGMATLILRCCKPSQSSAPCRPNRSIGITRIRQNCLIPQTLQDAAAYFAEVQLLCSR